MSKGKYSLVCVAHPDDETLFFGGLLQMRRKHPWLVVCMTDGNADGQGELRQRQFKKACSLLRVKKSEWWGFPDKFEARLPIDQIVDKLRALPPPQEIFTHGPLGEYEHPHHQDVCYAVHEAFRDHPRLYSVAYNSYPELQVNLKQKEYALKSKILVEVYGSETNRFLNLLPATFSEGFVRFEAAEITALYDFLAHKRPLKAKSLARYRWLVKYLERRPDRARPF